MHAPGPRTEGAWGTHWTAARWTVALAGFLAAGACQPTSDQTTESTQQELVSSPKKVAYYPVWASAGDDVNSTYPQAPSSIPWSKITHINLSFAGIDSSWKCAWVDDAGNPDTVSQTNAQNLIAYRNAHYPGVKVLISVGGWSMSYRFSEAMMNSTNRTTFVNSCVSMVNSMGADGLDIDWEFPGSLGAGNCPSGHTCQRSADATDFTAGLAAFRANTSFAGKLLTAAVWANQSTTDAGYVAYDYANFFTGTPRHFDWVNVMAYDFHGGWEPTVNFTSPFSEATKAIDFLRTQVGDANKANIVMGVPFYGAGWYNVAAPGTSGVGNSGTALNADDGDVSFRKAQAYLTGGTGSCTEKAPTTGSDTANHYIYCSGTISVNGTSRSKVWISYEDASTVGAKAAWVATNNYGGVMWWAQGDDSSANELVASIDSKLTASSGPAWQSQDIGSPALAGSFSQSSGTFTITGAGTDIWNSADQFRFVYVPVTGNTTLIARALTIQNTNAYAKVGVMMRNTLDTGSVNVHALAEPASASLYRFTYRPTTGATSSVITGGSSVLPVWLKVVRNSNTFSSFTSTDGVTWTALGSQTITMSSSMYVGIAVTSHNATALCTATVDNVKLTQP